MKLQQDLKGVKVTVKELLDIDAGLDFLPNEIIYQVQGAKSKNFYGGEITSNYNTYQFIFAENLMKVKGVKEEEYVYEFNLNDFISDLETLKNNR